jgi:rod shape-determining protein MreD
VALLDASSRRERETRSFPLFLFVALPVLAIGLQSFVTLHFARFSILDLPLLVTIYLAVLGRSPIAATFLGTLIGISQDALTHRPIGVNGITKAIIGYLAASLSERMDVDSYPARLVLCFVFTLLHSVLFLLITRRVLALEVDWSWVTELVRGLVNAVVGVLLFALLDLAKRRE